MKTLIKAMVVIFLSQMLFAQTEMIVNTYQDSTQRDPQIIRDGAGNYVIIWNSEEQKGINSQGDIYLQKFDSEGKKQGTEELVNTIFSGDQEKPAAAMNPRGDFIVVWSSFTNLDSVYDIKAHRYQAHISFPVNEFLVNTTVQHSQVNPDVDISDDGSFVIVWESWYQDGSDRGIYGQMFNSDGTKNGNEFLVNTTTAYSQARAAVKYFPDRKFIVVWESWKQDDMPNSGYGVYAQIFNANGSKSGNEFLVNTYKKDYQWFADIETFSDNSFVITWCSWEQDGDDGGIYFQRFSPEAQKIGMETLVNQTTTFYQWLPRITKLSNKNFAIVWSAWKQDGNREGVYAAQFDSSGNRISFENRLNDYTDSYQWEPDLIAAGDDKLIVTWSSWNQSGNDYDIVIKETNLIKPGGVIEPGVYNHSSGRTTSKILVHVIDTTALNGHEYEMTFRSAEQNSFFADIKDLTANKNVVSDFLIQKANNLFNLSSVFDGAAVQVIPDFDLAIDIKNSYFVNTSGTNIIFNAGAPAAGQKKIAPVDIALIWGSTDTLADGTYSTPLDTAIGVNGLREIIVPFKAVNITEGGKVNMLVQEIAGKKNKRWDPKENIIFITPPPYQSAANNTHGQVSSTISQATVITPAAGDTFYLLSAKPLTVDDKFRFRTDKSFVITKADGIIKPEEFNLQQNYPNPFNPSTNIIYQIPEDGIVKLSIYNILGEKVSTLVNEYKTKGQHKIKFLAHNLSSGLYFYAVEFHDKFITRKMMLIK